MSEHAQSRPVALSVRLETVGAAVFGFVLSAGVAAADGGVFADSWAWIALGSFLVATVRLIVLPRIPFGVLDVLFVGGVGAFAVWMLASTLWSPSSTASLREFARVLAYTGVVLLGVLVVRRRTVPALLAGVLTGVTAIGGYALLSRLLPDRLGEWDPLAVYRLTDPIGYWNGLGIYAAMGVLLAVGLTARSRSLVARGLAGGVPVVLITTVFFTFSRGAWLGLAVGLLAALALDPRRLQLLLTALALAPWPAIVLLAAWRSDALTDRGASLAEAADDGRGLLVLVVGMALASAAVAVLLGVAERRMAVPAGVRRGFAIAIAACVLVGAGIVWAQYGSPWSLADRGWDRFTAPPKETGQDVAGRLFDLSSNSRIELWRVALDEFEVRPVLGRGAGSYEEAWLRDRPVALFARDAHSLYFETLGELGVVGLALLVAALALPVGASVRARRDIYVPGAFAAYTAYLAHAGVDWDWELAGVSVVALVLAVALVASSRDSDELRPLRLPFRIVAPVVTGVLTALAFFSVMAYVPLERAREAYARFDYEEAASQARRAVDWAPWSSDALALLGRAQLGLGDTRAAKSSFREALEKSPTNWELWRDLAIAGGPAGARAPLERALELNPLERQTQALLSALDRESAE